MSRKGNLKKKLQGIAAPSKSQESQKKVHFEVGKKKLSQQKSQTDIPGHILDRAFLVRENVSWSWQGQLAEGVNGEDFPFFHLFLFRLGQGVTCSVQLPPPHSKL